MTRQLSMVCAMVFGYLCLSSGQHVKSSSQVPVSSAVEGIEGVRGGSWKTVTGKIDDKGTTAIEVEVTNKNNMAMEALTAPANEKYDEEVMNTETDKVGAAAGLVNRPNRGTGDRAVMMEEGDKVGAAAGLVNRPNRGTGDGAVEVEEKAAEQESGGARRLRGA
ncbi:hypothetical protein NSK_007748 [Nannochloropsis salina CCMP1776]|uniref:Uncharacterized protein n=1 Tax=Nannochloropsis salina CCMP1776 TaxID=1027361 RepID=A0A4D9CU78_9STRA|nr:hypothetical protein NSK_007748 [Nannochloropsis salina CCMP1776]|eukprot:TFJ81105.1 hypothetical protein NSK_007748 [Nannochloropsis salina CCMP1776]